MERGLNCLADGGYKREYISFPLNGRLICELARFCWEPVTWGNGFG